MRTLAQRREAGAQALVRQAEKNKALEDAAKKARNRRLYEVGGLVEKAGLLDLEAAALYGMLLGAAADMGKPNVVARWTDAGEKALAPEEDAREAAVATFPAGTTITRQLTAMLRDVHLRQNRILGHWEGRVDFAEAEAVVVANGGTIRRVHAEAAPQLREVAE